MEKFKAILELFKQGNRVADPVAWKTGQITVGVLTSFIASGIMLAKVFGYEIPITPEQEMAIATVILFIVGLCDSGLTVITSNKVGLPSDSGNTNNTQPSDNIMG